uniref:Uncharacterized protein n=2 Tax=Arundo donax TaxID=35708 RepID=A0A0A9EI21_ARUDO
MPNAKLFVLGYHRTAFVGFSHQICINMHLSPLRFLGPSEAFLLHRFLYASDCSVSTLVSRILVYFCSCKYLQFFPRSRLVVLLSCLQEFRRMSNRVAKTGCWLLGF